MEKIGQEDGKEKGKEKNAKWANRSGKATGPLVWFFDEQLYAWPSEGTYLFHDLLTGWCVTFWLKDLVTLWREESTL